MSVHHRKDLDRDRALAALAEAESMIGADRFAAAAALYRRLLDEPALDDLPAARTEVLANLGALLLHEARQGTGGNNSDALLDDAIDLLARTHIAYRLGEGAGSSAVSDANLALAYFQRHLNKGHHADLMSAHLALDGAEATLAAKDKNALDWVKSIRDLLVEHADRRRRPR